MAALLEVVFRAFFHRRSNPSFKRTASPLLNSNVRLLIRPFLMATNKNQHFVPRCYLRPFTWKAEGIAINVFNLERQRLILGAPVKNQSSKDYFYGTDAQLENAIQLIESGYSRSQRELEHRCVSLSDANKVVLQTFWLFQHLRTEAAAIRAA